MVNISSRKVQMQFLSRPTRLQMKPLL